ncbi:hypothetical protein JCM3775_006988 [Rhodotorula graminis]
MATPTSQPGLGTSPSSAPPPFPPLGLGVAGVDSLLSPPPPQGQYHDDLKAQVTSPLELTHFVDNLLNDLESRFDSLSQDVLSRLSSLSTRVDSLENSLADLMEGTSLPTATSTAGAPNAGNQVNGKVGV